jgi:hypothetical protein
VLLEGCPPLPCCVRVCPPEHAERLAAAGVEGRCLVHGCALCATSLDGDGLGCWACVERAIAVGKHEYPVADPSCLHHGVPDPTKYEHCRECFKLIATWWKRFGWTGPTYHEGPDCLHCDVCGLCKATGQVCRGCHRCPEHALEPWDHDECWTGETYFDRFLREVRPRVVHEYWDPATARWRDRSAA